MYDPMQYVLLFPYATLGYGIKLWKGILRLTMLKFYRFHLMIRSSSFNNIHRNGRLFQQYVVDMWAKIQQDDLDYLYWKQDKIHAVKYRTVRNHFLRNKSLDDVGYKLCPSTVYGSPRWLQQHCQDSLSIVRKFGRVDLFITFTANPNWPEVKNALFIHNNVVDRADIVCRIFKIKFDVCFYTFIFIFLFFHFSVFILEIHG